MIDEDIIALAKAISTHYTGKPDDYVAHVSTAAAFVKLLKADGWVIAAKPQE